MNRRIPYLAALAALLVTAGCSDSDPLPPGGGGCVGNPASLQTTTAKGNEQHGNMFDVVATNSVVVTGLTASVQAGLTNVTVEVYHRAGTHVGNETSSAGWTLAGSAVINGAVAPTPLPLTLNIPLAAGERHAFYVTTDGGFNYVDYTNGSAVGAIAGQDANISILQGTGNEYPFSFIFSPRIYNGTVSYTVCQ